MSKVQPLLSVQNLRMQFGGLLAAHQVSLQVFRQQIVSIIGPNGAGKTTVFNCLTGFYTLTSGTVSFNNEAIGRLPEYKIARKGIVRTFQNIRLFKEMTALENLLVAQHNHLNTHFIAGLLNTPSFKKSERAALRFAIELLELFGLIDCAHRQAGTLAYGQQRKLEIARCMMTRPKMLMLDEPAAGLNPSESEELKALLLLLRDQYQISVLLIEHDMHLVMSLSDYIYVLNQGTPLAEGIPQEIQKNTSVIKAYLGES